jgi:hypothetical protein
MKKDENNTKITRKKMKITRKKDEKKDKDVIKYFVVII